jgi:exosome complex component RRP42
MAMSEIIIPTLQKEKIEDLLRAEKKRLDGRAPEEFREIKVTDGVSKNSASGVEVSFGKTKVFAGVHLGLATPYPDSQDEGTFMTSAELHPMCGPRFDIGRPGIASIELARVIDRGIRESGLIDMKKLCIKEGEKVYQVFVDIVAINDDGNLLDVAGLAAIIALGRARMPVLDEEGERIEGYSDSEKIPLNKEALSFSMTFHKVGDVIVADPDFEEEEISKFRWTIAMGDNKGEPRITAMQKGKAGTISEEDMENVLNLAESKWKEMFPKVREYVFG